MFAARNCEVLEGQLRNILEIDRARDQGWAVMRRLKRENPIVVSGLDVTLFQLVIVNVKRAREEIALKGKPLRLDLPGAVDIQTRRKA